MTSPPGRGTIASPQRASSGPDSRMEARIRVQSSSSSSCLLDVGRVDPHPAVSGSLHVDAQVGDELEHRVHVADGGDVLEGHGLVREERRSHDRKGGVLVPGGPDRAGQRPAALDDEGFHHGVGD